MKKRLYQKIRLTAILAAAFAVSSICPIRAFAVESVTLPVQVLGDDVVSINLPVVSESETSVFDFIMDPQGLLYETDAVRYGGGRVEEGATLLFYNKEGEYDFSGHSDWLTVTNRSTVAVRVTVAAQVLDMGDVRLAENADFGESTEPEVYLAIEDDKGNILPLSADEQTTTNLEMSAAPEDTYLFRLDEENHTYQYEMSVDPGMVDFDTYSFGLIGACNPNAEWLNISIHPTITVTWYVEPIMPQELKEVYVEGKNESTASDVIEEDVLGNETGDGTDEGNAGDVLDGEEQSDNESGDEKNDSNAGDDDSLHNDEEESDNEPEESEGENESNITDDTILYGEGELR